MEHDKHRELCYFENVIVETYLCVLHDYRIIVVIADVSFNDCFQNITDSVVLKSCNVNVTEINSYCMQLSPLAPDTHFNFEEL